MPNLSRLQRQAYHCFQQGELDRAERLCTGILAHRPDDFDALHLLGILHFQRHRLVEALRFLAQALRVNSNSADALSNLGLALHATGRYDEAISSYRHALDLAPGHPEILYNLGNACLALDNVDDALSNYSRVLTTAPGHVGALVNRGNALVRLNRPVEAMASYDTALAGLPGHPRILTNRGHALRRLDRPVEALADFKAALAAAPEFAEAHFEAAMTQLSMGNFDAGWKEYEWRWKTGAFARHPPQPKAPLWLGERPISGKTILLHAEQGFGDTIQFIRYAPLLTGQGAKVICEVQPELLPLLSQHENVISRASHLLLPASRVRHSTCIVPCSVFPWRSGRSPGLSPQPFPISPPPRSGRRIGAIACRRGACAPDLSGPVSHRTRTIATGRSRCRACPHCLKIRKSGTLACSAICATRMAKPCAVCLTWFISAMSFVISPIPRPSSRCSMSSFPSIRRLRIWPVHWGNQS